MSISAAAAHVAGSAVRDLVAPSPASRRFDRAAEALVVGFVGFVALGALVGIHSLAELHALLVSLRGPHAGAALQQVARTAQANGAALATRAVAALAPHIQSVLASASAHLHNVARAAR